MCRRDAGARDAARVTETLDAWDDAIVNAEARSRAVGPRRARKTACRRLGALATSRFQRKKLSAARRLSGSAFWLSFAVHADALLPRHSDCSAYETPSS